MKSHWTFYLVAIYAIFGITMFMYRFWLVKQRRKELWKWLPRAYITEYGSFRAQAKTRIGFVASFLLVVSSLCIYVGFTKAHTSFWGIPSYYFDLAGIVLIPIAFTRMHIWPWSVAEVEIHGMYPPEAYTARGDNILHFWKMPYITNYGWFVSFDENVAKSREYTRHFTIWKWDLGSKEFNLLQEYLAHFKIF